MMANKQEPVAWRWREHGQKEWQFATIAPAPEDYRDNEIEPLYSASALASKDAEIAALWKALEPFAEVASPETGGVDDDEPDDRHIWEHPCALDLTLGDLRRALKAWETHNG